MLVWLIKDNLVAAYAWRDRIARDYELDGLDEIGNVLPA